MLLRFSSFNPVKDYAKLNAKICNSKTIQRSYCQKKDQNTIVDYVNTFGLGAEEGSSEWRDKKLYLLLSIIIIFVFNLIFSEVKVAGLFKQVIELSDVCDLNFFFFCLICISYFSYLELNCILKMY